MNSIFKILKKELVEVFRDKKSLAMMLIIPVLIPALVIGMSALFASEVNKPIDDYNRIGFNYKLSEVEKALAKEYNIIVYEIDDDKIEDEYNKGNIDLYITKEKNSNTIYGDDIESYTKEDNVYIINGNDNDTTSYAASLMKDFYNDYKESLQAEYLSNKGINPSEVSNILTVSENIITKNNYFASYIINYAFLFIIMAITISATYPATDATAGEKERGTLETLLTFPIKSRDIIIGKFLSISLSSIITGILGLLLTEVSLAFAKDNFDIYNGANLLLSSKALIFAIIVIIAYSFLISGLCVAIASKSKTFKEAQSALTPLTFISFFPGMIAFMMNIKVTNITAIIPFLNNSLIFGEIVDGNFNILHIILMLISSIIFIGLVLKLIITQYKSEKVLFTE